MITINLLPDNLKETSGPSSIGTIVFIFAGILINLAAVTCFIYLHFLLKPKYKTIEKHLQVRLDALKRKTKDYDKLKEERAALLKKVNTVKTLIRERVIWSKQLQDIAIFTHDRRVWFSRISVKTEKGKRGRRGKGGSGSYHKITLDAYSASRDVNIPNDYRKDIKLTDWWKEHFQPDGINTPAYKVVELPTDYYIEEYYHQFKLEINMKSKEKPKEKKRRKKRRGRRR